MNTPEMAAEMYRPLVASADIAVGVLLNASGTDMEMLPLAPRPLPESKLCALEIEWATRSLRFVGVMAWANGSVQAQLAPLSASVTARLRSAFEAYVTQYSTDSKVH